MSQQCTGAIERRAYAEQIAAGEEPHAVTPRGQMNEAIEEKRGLGAYLERGREWLQEMGQRVRDQAELAAHGMASLVQGAARTMRAGLQTSAGDGFDVVPALDQSPRQQQTLSSIMVIRSAISSGNASAGTTAMGRISGKGDDSSKAMR